LGRMASLAARFKSLSTQLAVIIYGLDRFVVAYEQVVMLKTIRGAVKADWIYRQRQWGELYSTDRTHSARQLLKYYVSGRKIEALFTSLKRDIGSAETQTRNPQTIAPHLNHFMLANSGVWIQSTRTEKTQIRRHIFKGRRQFAFLNVRRSVVKAILRILLVCFSRPHESLS
jgi:hypothetical protein